MNRAVSYSLNGLCSTVPGPPSVRGRSSSGWASQGLQLQSVMPQAMEVQELPNF